MLRDDVEAELRATHTRDGYLFPAYEDYCIGNVPDTVSACFDLPADRPLPGDAIEGVADGADRVVLVVVDGLGLDVWRRELERDPFVRRLTDAGRVTPLTSIYPSETAAAITTLETGQLACEHGRIGWNVFDPATDRSFLALDGSVKAGDDADHAPEAFDGLEYIYPGLASAGVACHRLQPFPADSPGVEQHRYDDLEAFGAELARVVEAAGAPSYTYGYLPHVDHAAHQVGTEAPAYRRALERVGEQLGAFVDRLDDGVAAETLLLVLADHGHVNTDPDRNVDLAAVDGVVDHLRRYGDGSPVRLSGSPRNVHLHLRPDAGDPVRESLAGLDALTFTQEEALDRGLFGDRPSSERFRRRCGDLVLTHRDLGTWFGDVEAAELSLVGMHGGLHPREMLVPFAAVRADRLASA